MRASVISLQLHNAALFARFFHSLFLPRRREHKTQVSKFRLKTRATRAQLWWDSEHEDIDSESCEADSAKFMTTSDYVNKECLSFIHSKKRAQSKQRKETLLNSVTIQYSRTAALTLVSNGSMLIFWSRRRGLRRKIMAMSGHRCENIIEQENLKTNELNFRGIQFTSERPSFLDRPQVKKNEMSGL